ncbi:hypothetical protein [Bartonella sp. LJL80]
MRGIFHLVTLASSNHFIGLNTFDEIAFGGPKECRNTSRKKHNHRQSYSATFLCDEHVFRVGQIVVCNIGNNTGKSTNTANYIQSVLIGSKIDLARFIMVSAFTRCYSTQPLDNFTRKHNYRPTENSDQKRFFLQSFANVFTWTNNIMKPNCYKANQNKGTKKRHALEVARIGKTENAKQKACHHEVRTRLGKSTIRIFSQKAIIKPDNQTQNHEQTAKEIGALFAFCQMPFRIFAFIHWFFSHACFSRRVSAAIFHGSGSLHKGCAALVRRNLPCAKNHHMLRGGLAHVFA